MLGYWFYENIKRKWLKWFLILTYESVCIWITLYVLLRQSWIMDYVFYIGLFIVILIIVIGQLSRWFK
ncbi:MAG: hypothetical protein ACOC56_04425 [Atribacterota bacterium]